MRTLELNSQLCDMCEADLEPTQRNLLMAFLPYLGAPLTGPDVDEKARRLIATALQELSGPLGDWELVWGPGLLQVVAGAVPANTMFVARHGHTGELFVSIAGTNPFSAYAWLAEDFDVAEVRAWGYGDAPEGVATSRATLTGLRALQGMVPAAGVPGENRTLLEFLEEHFQSLDSPVDITVSGHSLGGALSPTLALWLQDIQDEWDPGGLATLSVYSYAGPSPGNAHFADYLEERFGERLQRIYNPLDVVTHAWKVAELAELKALYWPAIPRDTLWDKAVNFLIAITNGISYAQIDPRALALNGEVKQELLLPLAPAMVNLVGQVVYQHTLAYFELLGLIYPEPPSALGRRLAGQTDTLVCEILKRAGLWAPLARLLGFNLRLLTEVYSRLPLLPSPVPDTSETGAK
jgi:MFS family permease